MEESYDYYLVIRALRRFITAAPQQRWLIQFIAAFLYDHRVWFDSFHATRILFSSLPQGRENYHLDFLLSQEPLLTRIEQQLQAEAWECRSARRLSLIAQQLELSETETSLVEHFAVCETETYYASFMRDIGLTMVGGISGEDRHKWRALGALLNCSALQARIGLSRRSGLFAKGVIFHDFVDIMDFNKTLSPLLGTGAAESWAMREQLLPQLGWPDYQATITPERLQQHNAVMATLDQAIQSGALGTHILITSAWLRHARLFAQATLNRMELLARRSEPEWRQNPQPLASERLAQFRLAQALLRDEADTVLVMDAAQAMFATNDPTWRRMQAAVPSGDIIQRSLAHSRVPTLWLAQAENTLPESLLKHMVLRVRVS